MSEGKLEGPVTGAAAGAWSSALTSRCEFGTAERRRALRSSPAASSVPLSGAEYPLAVPATAGTDGRTLLREHNGGDHAPDHELSREEGGARRAPRAPPLLALSPLCTLPQTAPRRHRRALSPERGDGDAGSEGLDADAEAEVAAAAAEAADFDGAEGLWRIRQAGASAGTCRAAGDDGSTATPYWPGGLGRRRGR